MNKDNEELKEEMENLSFKLKLSQEKEKLNDTNLKNLKEIQMEYENKLCENKKEYKMKEENLRKKYEIFEDNISRKIKDQENENYDKLTKLNQIFKETQKTLEKKEEDIWHLREKLKNSELFLNQKEQEFNNLLINKDKKLKDLEICIKKISDEAKNQLNSLTNVIEDYNKKFEEMKNHENKLIDELNNYKDNTSKLKKFDIVNQTNVSTYNTSVKNLPLNYERDNSNKYSTNKSKLSIDLSEVISFIKHYDYS